MSRRQVAGWSVLALIPAALVILAVLAGQLVELAVGTVITGFIGLAAWIGVRLLEGDPR